MQSRNKARIKSISQSIYLSMQKHYGHVCVHQQMKHNKTGLNIWEKHTRKNKLQPEKNKE